MLGTLQLLQPTTVDEASGALRDFAERGKVYAGGAELLLLMRHGLLQSEILVDVKKIERLHGITWNDDALSIGACVTHHTLETHPLVREHAPSFAHAESQVANARVRNQGTLGGNLSFNDPHSDPGTVLLVHNAAVTLRSQRGERQLPLHDFFLDVYETALEPDELMLDVQIPPLPSGMISAYLRLHRFQRPTLGVAAAIRKMNDKTIAESRLAVGCIGPRAQRLAELETKINGSSLSDAKRIFAEQKHYLRDLLQPVDDLLGGADYKLYMTGVMLGEALEQAAQSEGKSHQGYRG
jgi:aerobic carbon-monoxide dehydrogenase medium subunit